MRPVQRYESHDGTVWATPGEALDRDALLTQCAQVHGMLGPTPGPNGFVQHTQADVTRFRAGLFALVRSIYPALANVGLVQGGIAGRYLSDSGPDPVNTLWHRYECVCESCNREFSQPFNARHHGH